MKRCGSGGTGSAPFSRVKSAAAGLKQSGFFRHRRWHLDEVFVKINGVKHYLWRAVDHEGEVLESFVTKRRDKTAALKFLRNSPRFTARSTTTSTRNDTTHPDQ
jgi:transposase-like protein